MTTRTLLLLSISIVTALSAVLGVSYMISLVVSDRAEVLSLAEEIANTEKRTQHISALKTLVRDTSNDRARLMSITDAPIVSVINAIEDAAAAAGVKSTVDSISPTEAPTEDVSLSSYVIAVRSEGSFNALMSTLALYETLPAPVTIEQVFFERIGETWSLSVRVRALVAEKDV